MKKLIALLLFLMHHFVSAQNARFLIPYRESNKWGFCDTLGKVIIAPKYKSVGFFLFNKETKNPAARVYINDTTFTYIDSLGKPILPVLKTTTNYVVSNFHNSSIVFDVIENKNQHKLYIDKFLVTKNAFNEVTIVYNNNVMVKQKNKYGLLTEKGEVLIPTQFDKIRLSYYHTTANTFVWLCSNGNNKVKVEDKIKYNFPFEEFKKNPSDKFNLKDEEEMQKYYKELEEGRKRNQKSEEKSEIIYQPQTNNSTPTPLSKYEIEELFKDSLKKAFNVDTVISIYNSNGFYYVEKAGKHGIIDDSLKMFLTEKKYNVIRYLVNGRVSWLYNENQSFGIFIYYKNGKYGITNEFDDEILEPIYDNIENYNNGLIYYTLNNKKGAFVVNTYYKFIKPKYYEIKQFHRLNVTDKWSFVLFDVYTKPTENQAKENAKLRYYDTPTNFIGYVGENGIEYFKN